jgi:ATP-dependent RNA helicase DDX23/PRP28
MIDLGFEVDLNYILDSIPAIPSDEKDGRQTVMFSATMPPALESLAKKYLHKPAVVTIGVAGQAVAEIDQRERL